MTKSLPKTEEVLMSQYKEESPPFSKARSHDLIPVIELLKRYEDQRTLKPLEAAARDGRVVFRPHQALRPEQLARHMFEHLADHGGCQTSLLYNIGLFLPGLDPLALSTRSKPLVLSSEDFYKLVHSLATMEIGHRPLLPNATRLRERALFLYKLTSAVPVGIIHLVFDCLPELPFDELVVDSEGRFAARSRLSFEQHRILATAPLVDAVIARKFELLFLDELIVSNLDEPPKYHIRLPNNESARYRNGLRHAAETKGDFFPYAVLSSSKECAVSWVDVVSPPARLADRRFVLFRKPRSSAAQEAMEGQCDE